MNSCDEIKSAIDLMATASDIQRATIESHITSCDECTEYKIVADQNTKIFSSMNSPSTQIPAIDEVYTSLERQTKVLRRQTSFALAGLLTSVISVFWFWGDNDLEFSFFVISTMVFVCFSFVYVIRDTSQKAKKYLHLKESDDFISDWKKEVKANITETAFTGPIVALFAYTLPIWVLIRGGMLINFKFMILFSMSFVVSMFVLYRFLIVLPQLKRELALLESGDL